MDILEFLMASIGINIEGQGVKYGLADPGICFTGSCGYGEHKVRLSECHFKLRALPGPFMAVEPQTEFIFKHGPGDFREQPPAGTCVILVTHGNPVGKSQGDECIVCADLWDARNQQT